MKQQTLKEELTSLSQVPPHARHPSEEKHEYCLSSFFYSAKGYHLMLQSFPFPAVSSFYKHFGMEMKKLKEYICGTKYIPFLLEYYIEMYDIKKICLLSSLEMQPLHVVTQCLKIFMVIAICIYISYNHYYVFILFFI